MSFDRDKNELTYGVVSRANKVYAHDVDVDDDAEPGPEAELGKNELEDDKLFAGKRMFTPPLAQQRYSLVAEICKSHNVKSVVDFGCGECQALRYFKRIEQLEDIIAVDCDRSLLEDKDFLVKPLICDYIHRRTKQLRIRLFHGSLQETDARLMHVEAACLIEVIEHLPLSSLPDLSSALFNRLRPRLVVITTPNADFNVLFTDFSGMRHWDHKFEWSRNEFKQWCDEQATHNGYSVEYTGVGDAPDENQHLGQCTQIAVFCLDISHTISTSDDVDIKKPYHLVTEGVYPQKEAELSTEDSILLEANYYMRYLYYDSSSQDNEEEEDVRDDYLVSLDRLMSFPKMQRVCKNTDDLRAVLSNSGFQFSEDKMSVLYTPEIEDVTDGHTTCDTDWSVLYHSDTIVSSSDVTDCGQFSDAYDDDTCW